MANVITAIINVVTNPKINLVRHYAANNRANSMGDALEEYTKDIFAGTVDEANEQQRLRKINSVFSYLGNASNPPDSMLKGGDAIEVKKMEGFNALALNSSHPKRVLRKNNPKISQHCRDCEEWDERDMLYIVGTCSREKIKHLSFIYGTEYCADIETYTRIEDTIKNGLDSLDSVELAPTNELGRLNKVDPLGITNMRIRGMWTLENPLTVFNYIYTRNNRKNFTLMALINNEKYATFSEANELERLVDVVPGFKISDVEVKNPNNPAQLVPCKLITFEV